MIARYFPPCPIDGPIMPPVPFSHLLSTGAVPRKCHACAHLFEGECVRRLEADGRYRHLDHGPCPVPGPTAPVAVPAAATGLDRPVTVPEKCADCRHLAWGGGHTARCTLDADTWGAFPRGLDWWGVRA